MNFDACMYHISQYRQRMSIPTHPTQCHDDIPVACAPNRSAIKEQADRLSQHLSMEELHVSTVRDKTCWDKSASPQGVRIYQS